MTGIDNFFFPADDMPSAVEFYKELGLSVKFDFSDKGMVAFRIGKDEPAIILKDRSKFRDAKPALWLAVDDVHTEYAQLKKAGIRFLSEPFDIRTGMAVEFEDPGGNRLGLVDYIKR